MYNVIYLIFKTVCIGREMAVFVFEKRFCYCFFNKFAILFGNLKL